MPRLIEPVGNIAVDFESAEAWDQEQLRKLTLDERLAIARELRKRAYGSNEPDVRQSHRQ